MKICKTCRVPKQLDCFYTNRGMRDGLQNSCKECSRKSARDRYKTIKSDPVLFEKERDRHREKYHRLNYKEKHRPDPDQKSRIIKGYNNRFPEKKLAHNAVQHIETKEGNELHHWSYREEHRKEVFEISKKQHYEIHRFLVYDPEWLMYRRSDTMEILDTMELHYDYIKTILNL